MVRRRVSIVDALLVRPWWVSVIAAGAAYLLFAFGPLFLAPHPFAAGISLVAKNVAPYAAAFFLVIAFFAFVRALIVKHKFRDLNGIDRIRELSWSEFETMVGEAYRRQGYRVDENAVGGPDGGVDLVLRKHGSKFYVQCKQWKQRKVGVRPIRELYGVITAGGAAGGFFVASGEYTPEARAFARQCGIELIDGVALTAMIARVREPQRRVPSTTADT